MKFYYFIAGLGLARAGEKLTAQLKSILEKIRIVNKINSAFGVARTLDLVIWDWKWLYSNTIGFHFSSSAFPSLSNKPNESS